MLKIKTKREKIKFAFDNMKKYIDNILKSQLEKMKIKNILLLGSTGELGSFLLKELYNRNYNIVYSFKTKKKNKFFKESINKKNILQGFKCDLSKEKDINKLMNISFKKLKNIDCVINCSGIFYYDNVKNMNYKDLSNMFKINCF